MDTSASEKLDVKGLACFLGITFFITYPILLLLWLKGFWLGWQHPFYGHISLALTMITPAIAAFLVREYIVAEKEPDPGLVVGPYSYYYQSYLTIPLIFAAVYGLTWILISVPEWNIISFHSIVNNKKYEVPATHFMFTTAITSLTTATVVSGLHAFGQEYGWRGYLLPKLLPLGKKKALIISGVIWALWYTPFMAIGLHNSQNLLAGAAIFFVFTTLLGIYLGYLRLISGSVILASFAHGVFIAQFYGVWNMFFPDIDRISGGMTGLTGVVAFLALAIWILSKKDIQTTPEQ